MISRFYQHPRFRSGLIQHRSLTLLAFKTLILATLSMAAGAGDDNSDTFPEHNPSAPIMGTDNQHPSPNGVVEDEGRQQPAVTECGAITPGEPGNIAMLQTVDLSQLAAKHQNKEEFSCLSSVQKIHEEWIKDQKVLIDVRRPDQFKAVQIPGSLNLPPFSIKSKVFLKQKAIALIDEGRNHSQLEKLCRQLRHEGFPDVVVVAGGLHAWYREGYSINGEPYELSRLNRISPAELIASLGERDWRYIDFDGSLTTLESPLPASAIIEPPSEKKAFIDTVNKANRELDNRALSGFIVISLKGDDYQTAERLLRLTDAANVFYLEGGIEEFKRYLDAYRRRISRVARGFKEVPRCSG